LVVLEKTIMAYAGIKSVLVVVIVLFTSTVSVFAQASPMPAQSLSGGSDQASGGVSDQDIEMLRADLRSQRKEITAQTMSLTADEATRFWPVFDQYRQEAIKPNDDRWALMKDYAANYTTMSDEQAQNYIKRSAAIDEQLLALRMKYVPAFEKVIPSKKIALWYQIDRRIDLLINLHLSALIPIVAVSK
jgi:hypothetical protein